MLVLHVLAIRRKADTTIFRPELNSYPSDLPPVRVCLCGPVEQAAPSVSLHPA